MKKNVKYLGMAAAALLAVAPVVASTSVANAAAIQVVGGTTTNQTKGTVAVTLTVNNLSSLKAGANADTVSADLSATLDGKAISPKVFGTGKAYVIPADKKSLVTNEATAKQYAVQTLAADTPYVLVAPEVGVQGLVYGGNYNKGAVVPDQYGNTKPEPVFSGVFTISQGNTYFTQKINGKDTVVSGTTSIDLGSVNTVSALATKIQNEVVATNTNPSLQQSNKAALETQIKNALANAGVAVTGQNESFVKPVVNFTVPYTATFPNGSTATINVIVKVGTASTSQYSDNGPQFTLNGSNSHLTKTANTNDQYVLNVAQNASFNAADLLKAFNVTYSKENGAVLTSASVLSNNVNTAVPGKYAVVLAATNPAGVTNKVTVTVNVVSNGQTTRTVNYVKGYSVFAWNINGNRATISSTKFEAGSTVNTEGAPVTVGGVQYYKLAGTNEYIQAQYVDGSWKPATKPSHNNASNEEKVSGVATVVYHGRGGVKLLNGKGEYQTQVVKNGSSWKVFAKKTINGKTYYRIGNDNQWIPAQYVNFR
ncbi:SLAP domain-containing protein [uncultured Lactobacillus sp.]|uniref:SLAP domain-containing protein n=1 Tax=uncultured Lactobacillus sp. TaxID=153152 RepID=UPI002616A1F6|nr:SLAP domain-containing protein [uncultured Lactobacillus sp.]